MNAEQMKQYVPTVSLTCQHPVLTPGCDVCVATLTHGDYRPIAKSTGAKGMTRLEVAREAASVDARNALAQIDYPASRYGMTGVRDAAVKVMMAVYRAKTQEDANEALRLSAGLLDLARDMSPRMSLLSTLLRAGAVATDKWFEADMDARAERPQRSSEELKESELAAAMARVTS